MDQAKVMQHRIAELEESLVDSERVVKVRTAERDEARRQRDEARAQVTELKARVARVAELEARVAELEEQAAATNKDACNLVQQHVNELREAGEVVSRLRPNCAEAREVIERMRSIEAYLSIVLSKLEGDIPF